jgi:hypothetical protein
MLPDIYLHALSSRVLDHCPLLIGADSSVRKFKGFRFESFWPRLSGYQEVVVAAWGKPTLVTNPFLRVHIKMRRTSKALLKWAKGLIGHNKLLLRATSQLIAILEVVQDHRQLNDHEISLKWDLKARFLGMNGGKA